MSVEAARKLISFREKADDFLKSDLGKNFYPRYLRAMPHLEGFYLKVRQPCEVGGVSHRANTLVQFLPNGDIAPR